MNKVIVFLILATLTSCSPISEKKDVKDKTQFLVFKKNSVMVDICDQENMPGYPYRPKMDWRALKEMSEKEMDEKIRKHIEVLESHIDTLEGVIVKTRKRVELCR